jgi:uncharacterized iron-regulated protein
MTIKAFRRCALPSWCVLLALAVGGSSAVAAGDTGSPGCSEPGRWLTLAGSLPRPLAGSKVIGAALLNDIVLLGEEHDNEDHHRWQLQVLAALYGQRQDLVIGLEMFPRRIQPVLDRWVQGRLSTKEFLTQSEWDSVWGQPIALYMPLFDFARINRIPMLALNIDQRLSRAISEKGWDAVPVSEREGLSRAAPPSPAYRDFLFETYRQHPVKGGTSPRRPAKSDPEFKNFVDAQLAWDRAMAEALAQRLGVGADRPLLVGIIGSGHLRFGYGVPHQLRDLGIGQLSTLLPVTAGDDCREFPPAFADAVFAIAQQPVPPPDPPRLGVQLDESSAGGGVRIGAVTAGSLAEQSGLKVGDQLLEVAGRPVQKNASVIAAVRRQAPGTWLPLRLRRGDASLDLVVRFPPAP